MKKLITTVFMLIIAAACALWVQSIRNELVPGFDARQEVMESGETVTGSATYVKHSGLMNWGVKYAELEYEVDGKLYHSEVRFAQNFRKLPGEEDSQGRHPVVIHYDEDEPETAAIECAQKGWKLARFSLLMIIILLWLNCGILTLATVGLVKEELIDGIARRYN